MSTVSEKVAYLNGLFEGLDLQDEKCKKLISSIIDTLGAISDSIDEQDAVIGEISDCLDDVCDEIDDLDDAVFEDEYDEDEDDGFFEVVCPSCGEVIYFDEEMLDNEDGLICPHCNEPVDIELCMDKDID